MNDEELTLETSAVTYIKSHEKELVSHFCPPSICHSVEHPVTLFMAGSPGAGKTEVSKGLVRRFQDVPIRIDADEIRSMCPGYEGSNAHLFQKAANKGVNILYDYARHHSINCIVDGTFAYKDAVGNVEKSLNRNRKVEIWFVYQEPVRAWEFTQAREAHELRRVSKEIFMKGFFDSRTNVRMVKEKFGRKIEVNILVKDYIADTQNLYLNVSTKELDHAIKNKYSEEILKQMLT